VVLEVSDDGPGIPPADRGRVLEPFFRLPTSPGTGSGLGLSIVRATIERLGGTLALSDAGGAASGLRVRVTLAAGDPPARPGRPHA
jgi:signal transduction histidine kinase